MTATLPNDESAGKLVKYLLEKGLGGFPPLSSATNLADEYLGREADGSYDGGFEVYFGVSCINSAWPTDPKAVLAEAKKVGAKFPRVGEALVRCAEDVHG